MMWRAQRVWAAYTAAEKEFNEVCRDAHELGMNFGGSGQPKINGRFRKLAIKSINQTQLSIALSGGRNNITEKFIPKKYALEVGFKWVESAPLVRSSYHADGLFRQY